MPSATSRNLAAHESLEPPDRVLSTLNRDGSRRWLAPRPMPGRFMTARRIVAWALIAIFALMPYIPINGKPMILLDLPSRRFTILGTTFLPTDTLLLALLFVAVFVTIFMLTALFGRVWCGWACPQTVYMEFLFRPIERLFEGTPGRRKRGIQGTGFAKLFKYVAFFVVACFVAHTFLAYFVGVERLAQWVRQSPFEHPSAFLVMAAVTALILFDFTFFREQTCIVACPYGRFQSVMLDRHSLIVSYDERRGEPRGPMRRNVGGDLALPQAEASGDCIDCGMCTVCCPTGIDIRQGLQMECIGCAQCIDACDAVMEKVHRPKGLIRYSSQAAMEGLRSRVLRARVIVYPTILAIVLTVFVVTLSRTGGFDLTVLRGLGATFIEQSDERIANPVRVKIVNRTEHEQTYTIEVAVAGGPAAVDEPRIEAEENPVRLAPGESRTVPVMIVVPRALLSRGHAAATVAVADGDGRRRERPFELQGPRSTSIHP